VFRAETSETLSVEGDLHDGLSHLVTAGDRTLRVSVRPGDAKRTPLLLINGIGASLETFGPLMGHLDPDVEVIRFDPPGVGGSPAATRPYRFHTLATVLARVLDHLGHERVDVLGISWGGALAQQFAFSQRSRTRRLVLVATGTGALMVPGSPKVLARLATPRRYRDPNYLLSIAPELYGGSIRGNLDEMMPLLRTFRHGGQVGGYAMQVLAGAGWTSVPFLPFIAAPTLVLAGDDDPIIPAINGRIIARLIRNSELEIYHGGHVELVAQPTLLSGRIEEFLTRS
jgi:poly(3-hydroxyalkanoate) depolymerase